MAVDQTSTGQNWAGLSALALLPHTDSTVTPIDAILSQPSRVHLVEIPERQLRINVEAAGNPHWLNDFLKSCHSLLRLKNNWDSYGAVELDPRAFQMAYRFLNFAMVAATPPPAYVPTSTGGIQLEWHEKGIDIEIGFEAGSNPELYIEDHKTSEIIEEEIEDTNYNIMREYIDRLG